MNQAGERRDSWPLAALGLILAITVAWWAAALWPLPAETPEWVARARAACFGSTESGLPDAGGWILLIGTPIAMVTALLIIAGGPLRAGLARVAARGAGRAALLATSLALVLLAGAAGARVLEAAGRMPGSGAADVAGSGLPAPERLDRAAPPLSLVDQYGTRVTLEQFRGRPVMVTFAYGRCETVCPVIVQSAKEAQALLADLAPVLLVITLDPWRDTPARLPHVADSWALGPGAHLLGGEVAEVQATLDGWEVPRARDPRTGEIAHPSLVYLLDPAGRIVFAATGNGERIAAAARRM